MTKIINMEEFYRCCALDQDGNRCKNTKTIEIKYFGDPVCYSNWNYKRIPRWVVIRLCKKHRTELDEEIALT